MARVETTPLPKGLQHMSTDASPIRRLLPVPDHYQMQQLLWVDIRDPAGCVRLREDRAPGDLTASVYLANARQFLSLMGESGIPATVKGNLSRAFVLAMNERMRFSEYDGEWRPYIKVHKEDDVWPLHILRVVLTVGGVIRKYRGRFLVTKRGAKLAADERAGALQAHLVRTFFGAFNLGYLDRFRDDSTFQTTVAYSLWMMRRIGDEWMTPERLREFAQLGLRFMEETDERGRDDRQWIFDHRRLRPLENFGLLETRVDPTTAGKGPRRYDPYEVRKTALYDRFIAFELPRA
jgi:hypothetical protein